MARVTLVTDEILGYTRTGGIGTATTFLALGLARIGHRVEILYSAKPPQAPLGEEWERLYSDAGVAIRILPRSDEVVAPSYFGRMRSVELALAADPPDVAIVQDLAAPAYTAIRSRTLGLGFEDTRFVVYCHGTRQWITDAAGKVRVLPGALAITNLERASIELADAVVSPSMYLVDWMRAQGWELPQSTHVIPHLTRAIATGEPQPRVEVSDEPVRRLAFFGRFEDRKGIQPFIDAVNALPASLVERAELDFLGRPTPAWMPQRIRLQLRDDVSVSFGTELDQTEALDRLARPGTVAVMPSFEETFGNTVRECLDYGIPFIASDAAAIRELVGPDDRERVLCSPTTEGIGAALRRVLETTGPWPPARAAFDAAVALEQWPRIVETRTELPAPAREDAGAFELLLDSGDAAPGVREALIRAQQFSGADVVTCGIRLADGTVHLFHGQPRGLGILANHYGTVALVRRSLLADVHDVDPRWPLLARLSAGGAKIVSVTEPLVTAARRPETLQTAPEQALAVAREFERVLPRSLRGLARLTAGLAAERAASTERPAPRRVRGPLRRLVLRRR